MSSFFTLPASQKKRKISEISSSLSSRKRPPANTQRLKQSNARAKNEREESISGSESEEIEETRADEYEDGDSDDSGIGNETAAEQRLRLAEQYLENVRSEAGFDPAGFDAAELDRDIIAERLKEDVAETKGKIYRRIASKLDFAGADHSWFKFDSESINAVAIQGEFAYTASRDLTLCKWRISKPRTKQELEDTERQATERGGGSNSTPGKKPTQLVFTRGSKKRTNDSSYSHHTADILCIAASEDGKFVATGGKDRKLIVWDASTLKALKVFSQHRDSVTGLTFRRGTNQLYSCSADRTIKIWSLDELAYIETLFGHQDSVASLDALAAERCVSVGARDRTARLWKIGEESQLVFRGSDPSANSQKKKKSAQRSNDGVAVEEPYGEGSIDTIALIDDNTFITGSDNGSLSLWSIHKKKPVFTYPCAHGRDPPLDPQEALTEARVDPRAKISPQQPRWITALACIPYSDVILSGSWDGHIRAWKIDEGGRSIIPLGPVGSTQLETAIDGISPSTNPGIVRGVVNSLALTERGDRGKDGLCVIVGVGKDWRLGRWRKFKGKNGACVLEIERIEDTQLNGTSHESEKEEDEK